jgi:spermidine/putrescine transport system permease protein
MKSSTFLSIFIGIYLVIFFGYLFGPLILMSVTAFNSSSFPRVAPWDCFTFEWFGELAADDKLLTGLGNSFIIAGGVVFLSVFIGLAGALVLTQVWPRLRPWYYTIVISPILVPGVVLGISTLLFWDRLGVMFDASYDSVFYNGMILTILGQSTFISAYCMLVFIARLQRFDTALEEAALDLGATHVQTFRKITLPFLYPAIGSAAVLAFLASFENYNTTVFTIIADSTLTTVLANQVRYGITPAISSLAVIIVALTLFGAIAHEALRRREELKAQRDEITDSSSALGNKMQGWLSGNPAMILLMLVFVAGLGTVWFSSQYSPDQCKLELREEKERLQQRQGPDIFGPSSGGGTQSDAPAGDGASSGGSNENPGQGTFGDVFAPNNLEGGESEPAAPGDEGAATQNPGASTFGDVFNPGNLDDVGGQNDDPQ